MSYTQEQLDMIIDLRKQGKGVTEIGRIMGVDRKSVSDNLKKLGLSTERNPIIKNIFHEIDSEEKAYWLGMLYSDGSVNKTNGQVTLGLNEKDLLHLEKLKKFLQCNNKISYSKKTKSYRFSFLTMQ